MIKYFIVASVAIIVGVACKSKKHTASENTVKADSVAVAVASTDSIRLSVSFFSPGSGINRDAYKKLEGYIERFENENNLKLTTYKVPWGREGEVDFCFKLSTIDKKKGEEFVSGVKNLLSGADKVNIKENCNCRYWPKR